MIKGILGLIKSRMVKLRYDEPIAKQLKKIAYVEQRAALDLTFSNQCF